MPNPDPEDISLRDISAEFISLFVLSRKCQKVYSKERKIKIFYEALTVEKSAILGNSLPKIIVDKFKLWAQAVRHRAKWTLEGIAESVFIISKHVHDRQAMIVKGGGTESADSKIVALRLMFCFFINEIELAEAIRLSQNRAAAVSLSSQQQRSIPSRPLPANFRYDANKVCLYAFIFF
jgi:hypothetical protein